MKLLILALAIALSFITTRKATYDIAQSFSSIEMNYEKVQRKNTFIFILRTLLFAIIIWILPVSGASRLYSNLAVIYTVICMHLSNLKFLCTKVPQKLLLFDICFRFTIFLAVLI